MNNWNKKNALWMLLYLVIYMAGTIITCVLGSIHPIMFVCYQITAGILLSGVAIKAYDRIKAPGVAAVFSLGIVIIFIAMNDLSTWHIVPLIVIAIAAEGIRFITSYTWIGDMIASVITSFATFGFYGQIWFNRDFTYTEALEEMPSGYADKLMDASPAWSFAVVLIIGITLSIIVSNLTAKIFKLERA